MAARANHAFQFQLAAPLSLSRSHVLSFTMAADAISRHVRVFISSSFADMKKEREGLASDVFPQLRSLCASKGISLADVDLRWGIDADMEKPKVIAHCLAEV
jgi:hypothetical protein